MQFLLSEGVIFAERIEVHPSHQADWDVGVIGCPEESFIAVGFGCLDILLPEREGSDDHRRAIREAALSPPLHAEIWKKYDGQLPSDAALKRYLLLERDFNDSSVDGFIRQFRRSLAFSENHVDDTGDDDDNGGEMAAEERQHGQSPQFKAGDYVRRTPPTVEFNGPARVTRVSEDGQWAFVEGQEMGVAVSMLAKTDPNPPPFFPEPPRNPDFSPVTPPSSKPVVVLVGYNNDGRAIYATVSFDVPMRKGLLRKLATQLEAIEKAIESGVNDESMNEGSAES